MISYILQIVAFQLLFLLVYEVLLKRETFFTWNRWYLLITALISLLLPFLKIEALASFFPAEGVTGLSPVWLPEVFIGEAPATLVQTSETAKTAGALYQIDWWLVVYGTGVVVSLLIFFRKYQNLSRLFRFRIIAAEKNWKIIEIPNSNIACTFYKTIFLGDQLSEAERKQILFHEMVHIKQLHSLDLLFFEVLKVLLWFNPLVYIYQNRIATLHEFIADAAVVKKIEKHRYYEQLLNSAFNTGNVSFINQFFNHSLIKNRIVMLKKSRSKNTAKLKYLLLLPLMLMMLTTVAFTESATNGKGETLEKAEEKPEIKKPEEANLQEPALPLAVVDEVPVFPGCDQEEREALQECLAQKITDYVNRNYNTAKVKPFMAVGYNRIMVQFKIDRTGRVTDVRSKMVTPGPDEEAKAMMVNEANRVVGSLPQMKPAKHEGKEVGVLYFLPIQLYAPEEEGQ